MRFALSVFFVIGLSLQVWSGVNEPVPTSSLSDIWRWKELSTLAPYQIRTAQEGENGVLWFVYPEGLLEYDGRALKEHAIPEVSLSDAIDIFIASDESILVIKESGFVHWNNGQVRTFDQMSYGLNDRNVVAEMESGQFLLTSSGKGLWLYDGSRLSKVDLDVNAPSSVLLDSRNNLWVVEGDTHTLKVFEIDETAGVLHFDMLHTFPGQPNNIYQPRLFEDSKKRVWVIDPDDQDRCYRYENYQKQLAIEGLVGASLWAEVVNIVETHQGDMIFLVRRILGSYDGSELSLYDIRDYPIPSSPTYLRFLASQQILIGGVNLNPQLIDASFKRWKTYHGLNYQCEDRDGNSWYLSSDRKAIVKGGGQWHQFDTSHGLIDTPNRIIAGSDGTVWVSGAHEGVAAVAYRMHDQWHRFGFPEASNTFSHLAALETNDGAFVFGCGTPPVDLMNLAGGGVVFQKRGDSYHGTHLPPPVFITRPATMAEREGDGLYMGEDFIAKGFSGEQITALDIGLFDQQWVDHMIVDEKNHIWVACLGIGIYQYDGVNWTLHGPDTGLTSRYVLNLLYDRERSWILALTEEGFFYFDGSTWGKRGFEGDVSLKRENHTLFQGGDGSIWINFSNRSWFLEGGEPSELGGAFKTICYLPDSDPPETFAELTALEYPEGSQILVQFHAIDYWDDTAEHEFMYAWSLDGGEWSRYAAENKTVLTGIVPGRHTLQVRSRDRAGNVDPTPVVLEFAVIPPMWKHPLFIAGLVALLVLIGILAYSLFRIRIKAALALDNFKLDFFTNLSHELRNPLAVILIPVERLLSEETDGSKRKRLHLILRNARKMQGMVDQLLQFRKIETGKWTMDPADGEIISFLRDELSNLEPLWDAKGQHFELSIHPESFYCNFDPLIIRTIVSNLISNAVKFSANGTTIQMWVDIEADETLQRLTLQVDDEGIAIPPHEQEHILMPFYRVKNKTAEVGSGIGLALVNQLVCLCGGSIAIKSPLTPDGRGSSFVVTLPLDPASKSDKADTPMDPDAGVTSGKPCVLIVEDNADFRHVLVQELEADFQIVEAEDGVEGLRLATEQNPDLILSDVMMPQMGGFELCQRLKSDMETSHIPVVLLTAKSADEHRIKGLQLGADAYIPKPLNVKHLIARIENLLKSRTELRRKFSQKVLVEPSDVTVTPTDERILKKAIEIVDENMNDENFNIVQFSQLMGMSKSSLVRKLRAITDMTPLQFIQQMRLKRAATLLATGSLTVSEAACRVGMYNMSYFSKVFRTEFGVVPSEYRDYLNKEKAGLAESGPPSEDPFG